MLERTTEVGQLSIVRRQCGGGKQYIQIEIWGKGAQDRIVHVQISLDALMQALTGFSCMGCDVDVFERAGKENHDGTD